MGIDMMHTRLLIRELGGAVLQTFALLVHCESFGLESR